MRRLDLCSKITGALFFVFSGIAAGIGQHAGDMAKSNNCLSILSNATNTIKSNCAKAEAFEICAYVLFGLTILDLMAFIIFGCRSKDESQQISVVGNSSALQYGTVEQATHDSNSERLVSNSALQNV